jgi:hypothetical protein
MSTDPWAPLPSPTAARYVLLYCFTAAILLAAWPSCLLTGMHADLGSGASGSAVVNSKLLICVLLIDLASLLKRC